MTRSSLLSDMGSRTPWMNSSKSMEPDLSASKYSNRNRKSASERSSASSFIPLRNSSLLRDLLPSSSMILNTRCIPMNPKEPLDFICFLILSTSILIPGFADTMAGDIVVGTVWSESIGWRTPLAVVGLILVSLPPAAATCICAQLS